MKILLIHNAYTERGGEDEVVQAHQDLLERHGHDVSVYLRSNVEIESRGFLGKAAFLLTGGEWNQDVYQELRQRIRAFRPDVAHVHNIFYLLTPSVYAACVDENVPIVQSLHNYRWLLEKNGPDQFLEFEVPVSDFKKHLLRHHIVPRVLRSFDENEMVSKIDAFIALSRFSRQKFTQYGYPENKMHVMPPSFAIERKAREDVGSYALFVGRLIDYKGIRLLLRDFNANPDVHLRIIGDGPLKDEVQKVAKLVRNIDYIGRLPYKETLEEIRRAACLIAPSYCYETFGRTIAEAFACGTPVIASDHGAMAELIEEGKTGFLFRVGDGEKLMEKIRQILSQPELAKQMGENARQVFEKNFSEGDHYRRLLALYEQLVRDKKNAQVH